MTNDDSVYRYGGNEAIMVRNEIWGTKQAADELNRLTRQLTAALATVEKCKEQLATAQRAGDNLRGYAKLLCDAVPPPEEHSAKFDRLRRAAERWESLRSVEFVVADEAAAAAKGGGE
jgi:hypothetical protein